jgi:hypothetical protein
LQKQQKPRSRELKQTGQPRNQVSDFSFVMLVANNECFFSTVLKPATLKTGRMEDDLEEEGEINGTVNSSAQEGIENRAGGKEPGEEQGDHIAQEHVDQGGEPETTTDRQTDRSLPEGKVDESYNQPSGAQEEGANATAGEETDTKFVREGKNDSISSLASQQSGASSQEEETGDTLEEEVSVASRDSEEAFSNSGSSSSSSTAQDTTQQQTQQTTAADAVGELSGGQDSEAVGNVDSVDADRGTTTPPPPLPVATTTDPFGFHRGGN